MRETSRSRSGGPSDALFQIGPLNAPGPDGFPARFFQRNWDVLREDVTLAVRKFFEEGVMPEGVNTTIIVLIPKKEASDDLKDFRPISLCNVVYKIISKCLANRIRPLLHDIIAPNQSAFIPGRMITDNAIIAFECLHAIQSGNENARKFCAYKLDLSKAYDRVEWNYLDGVMRKLGFNDKWINWTMQCVTSVTYQVSLNGVLQSPFKPTRGLQTRRPTVSLSLLICGRWVVNFAEKGSRVPTCASLGNLQKSAYNITLIICR